MFPAEDAAKFELERLKIMTKWKRLAAKSWKVAGLDPRSHAPRYYAYYGEDAIRIGSMTYMRDECTRFATAAAVGSAISEIGEENVKKYILGIPE